MLSLQESMQKKPLTQISFDFEDLAAVPDETSVNSNATAAVEESTPPAVSPTIQAVPEKEEVVAASLEESGVRIRAIRKKK